MPLPVKFRLRIFPPNSGSSGYSVIELAVAAGIMVAVGFALMSFLKFKNDQELYLRARQSVSEDADLVFNSLRKAWNSRIRACGTPAFTATSLSIQRFEKGSSTDPATIAPGCPPAASPVTSYATWTTQCQPVPMVWGLKPAKLDALRRIGSSCMTCPVGQRPVIESINQDTGGEAVLVPGDTKAGSHSKTLAGSICFTSAGTASIEARVSFAIIGGSGNVQKIERLHILSTKDGLGTGVEVLR